MVHHAGEHTGVAAPQGIRGDAGMFQCLPAHFQQEPLLWIHRQRLAGADPEESSVEVARVVEEAALAHVAGPPTVGIGAMQPLEIPSTIGGESGDCVATTAHKLPQILRRAHSARVAAGHSHDRDRLPVALLHIAQAAARLAQVDRDALEVLE